MSLPSSVARRVLPALALLAAASCGGADAASGGKPSTPPTEPPPAADQQSSVCAAYVAQLNVTLGELAKSPRDEALLDKVATYKAIIADACN